MKSFLPAAAAVIGLLMLVASFLWGTFSPAGAGWTKEKSLRLQELRRQANILGAQTAGATDKPSMHGGESTANKQAEYEKVKAELKTLGEEAEGKIQGPQTIAMYIRWAGVACILIGALVAFASRGG